MKYLLLLFLISINSFANDNKSIELIGPGITYHVIDNGVATQYSNKLSSDGRWIKTNQLGIRFTNTENYSYNSTALFIASNSIGSTVYGGLASTGMHIIIFDTGFVFGGYVQNNEDFRAKGIEPYSLAGNTNAFVPLMGMEFNVKFPIGSKIFLGLNNLITPIITNHNLSIGLKY